MLRTLFLQAPSFDGFDGGASISLELGIRAAGWASQVGNQKELISRLAW